MPLVRAPGILSLSVAGAIVVFWITSAMSGFFLDRPFLYMGPNEWSNNLVDSLARFPTHPEAGLQLVADVLLVPALVALVIRAALSRRDAFELAWMKLGATPRQVALGMAALATLAAGLVAFLVLERVLLIDDERAYAFQSSLFAHGEVALPAVPAAFRNPMFLLTPWMGKYPPGQSLLLLPGILLREPHVVTPLLGGALVFSTYGFVREVYGERQALLAAALLAASPFLWCASGTLMAFTGEAVTMMASLWLFARGRQRGSWPSFAGAGALFGLALMVRPFDAVTVAFPMGCWLLADVVRSFTRRDRPGAHRTILPFAVGAAPLVAAFLAYNWLTLGSPFRLGYVAAGDYSFGFYTYPVPGHPFFYTPWQAVTLLPVALIRLDLWLLGWPSGLLLVLAGILLARTAWDRFIVTTVIFFGLSHTAMCTIGTWDVGPTYCLPIAPLLVVLAARGLRELRGLLPVGSLGRSAIGWLPVAGTCVALSTIIPLRLMRLAALSSEIEAPWRAVAEATVGDAIVVLPSAFNLIQAGYALGYPYEIESGPGTAHLVRPQSTAELDEARRVLGKGLPVYVLALDKKAYQELGVRRYQVRPLS